MTDQKQPLKIDKRIINQSEIARRLGVSKSLVSLVLNGKRKNQLLYNKILDVVKNAAHQHS